MATAEPVGARPDVSLVIPAFNEEQRLPSTLQAIRAYFDASPLTAEVLVVDSASTDLTEAVAESWRKRLPELRVLRVNRRGKGAAVRTGVLASTGKVVLFADADLSWDPVEIGRFLQCIPKTDVIIGSREGEGAERVREPWFRHVMGRIFNWLVQALAVPGIEDTQCGFKAFRADAARAIFERQTLDSFGFDVEVLYLARLLGYRIEVVPIRWEHKENSRVSPVRDSLAMLADVLRIRWRAARGGYRRASWASR